MHKINPNYGLNIDLHISPTAPHDTHTLTTHTTLPPPPPPLHLHLLLTRSSESLAQETDSPSGRWIVGSRWCLLSCCLGFLSFREHVEGRTVSTTAKRLGYGFNNFVMSLVVSILKDRGTVNSISMWYFTETHHCNIWSHSTTLSILLVQSIWIIFRRPLVLFSFTNTPQIC